MNFISKTFVISKSWVAQIAKVTDNAFMLFAAIMIVCVWMSVVVFDQMAKKVFRQQASQEVTNVARVFGEHVARAIKETDKTLLLLRAIQEDRPDTFNLNQWVGANEFKSELVVQYAQISASGMLLQSNVGSVNKTVNLSDREHFTVHEGGADDKLFISKPVMGRASGKWSIQLSRRLRQPDGSFGGVIVGSINPAFLAQFYDGISIGASGTTILVGLDGVVRAGGGDTGLALNRSIVSSSIFEAARLTEAGFLTSPDPLNDELRLFGFRAVSGYPLLVLAGISEKEILLKGRLRHYFSIGVGTLLTILGGLLCATLHLKSRLDSKVALLSLERDKSAAANLAKSSFLAMMSHEIRTPMNAVIGLSSTLMNRPLQTSDKKLVSLINQEGDRLLVILNDILDYSMMESGKLRFENIPFIPTEILSSVLAIAGPSGIAKGLTLSCEYGSDLPTGLIGDAGRLQQVLLNLVSNSIKFTRTGSVTAKVECLEQGDGFAVMQWSVRDTGIGIAPENINKLFDNFVQADASINRSFGGSGLGLAICKRIICQMGGTIRIQSVPTVETTVSFIVELPKGEAQPIHELPASKKDIFTDYASSGGKSLRLLLVDDSQVNLLVISELLSEFELSIETAMNGIEAVAAANQFRYDLILMDMLMPEMDGIQAAREIRTQGGPSADVPIIAVTANAFAEDVKSCKDVGMNGFVSKPIRKNAMVDEMIRVLKAVHSDLTLPASQMAATAAATELLGNDFDLPTNFHSEPLRELVEALGKKRTNEAVQLFIADTAARIVKLKEISNQGNSATVTCEAHSIRGSSATFGLIGLSALAGTLENAPKTATPEDLEVLIAAIDLSFCFGCTHLMHKDLSAA